MSTRATIQIEGVDYCQIYKHWDGYPKHMVQWLKAFNKMFVENRGVDPHYKLAQVLRFADRYRDVFDLDPSETTGWGIVPLNSNMGRDYNYILKDDGSVKVERGIYVYDSEENENWEYETIKDKDDYHIAVF